MGLSNPWSNELCNAHGQISVIYLAATEAHAVHPMLPGPGKDLWSVLTDGSVDQ